MLKLLHVEDDEDIREVARMALDFTGSFEVMQCASGEEALRRAPDFAPDVILLDMMMPGMCGPTTLKALRELPGFASTPAIFMTARAQPSEVAELKALSALEVLIKPFDPVTLGSRILEVMEAA